MPGNTPFQQPLTSKQYDLLIYTHPAHLGTIGYCQP